MQIDLACRAIRTRLQDGRAAREFARVAAQDPELARFESCMALLEHLRSRQPESRLDRNRVIGALLRLSQQHRSGIALELLLVAYFPSIVELAGDLLRYRRTRDVDECQAAAIEAFLDATQLVHFDADEGTARRLILKARQRAIRRQNSADRLWRHECPSPDHLADASSPVPGPESELLRREALPLAHKIEGTLDPLLDSPCDERVPLRATLMRDEGSVIQLLRQLHPDENLHAVNLRYQRVRTRRSRYLRHARKSLKETLSQFRGYLDILDQEDS